MFQLQHSTTYSVFMILYGGDCDMVSKRIEGCRIVCMSVGDVVVFMGLDELIGRSMALYIAHVKSIYIVVIIFAEYFNCKVSCE